MIGGDTMAHMFRHFPREIDMRKRKVVHSMDELQHYVTATNGADNLTTTVYGFRQLKPNGHRGEYNTAVIPHFVMDFDYERALNDNTSAKQAGEKCFKQVYALHQHLVSNDWRHAMFFTGGGVHIWVSLDKTYEPTPAELGDFLFSGRKLIEKWVKTWDLTTLDPVVSFRPDRHIRIPNTYNFKRGLWGMPLSTQDIEQGWEYVLKKAQDPHGGMTIYGNHGMAMKVKKRDPNQPFAAESVDVDMKRIGKMTVLPCLASAACEKGSNPTHEARVYLVQYLQDRLRSFARPPSSSRITKTSIKNTIASFIADLQWSDYNEETTRGYIEHSVNREYITPSCRTLYEKGYCIGRCPFYDRSGGQ
jgi:hypothetical protein